MPIPLKTLYDGLELRNRILSRFELAAAEPNPERRRRLLTFAIVGGGTTGVELAGALMGLIRALFRRDYAELRGEPASVVIVEALDKLLAEFSAGLGSYSSSSSTGSPTISSTSERCVSCFRFTRSRT